MLPPGPLFGFTYGSMAAVRQSDSDTGRDRTAPHDTAPRIEPHHLPDSFLKLRCCYCRIELLLVRFEPPGVINRIGLV